MGDGGGEGAIEMPQIQCPIKKGGMKIPPFEKKEKIL